MPDIFISYSRKDSEQALQLAERLRAEGMSVWIDQQGIEAAKTWSEEIVNAIEGSKAFVLLLSSSSIESDNVARELSLAFESKRPLVPVAIEDITLTPKFKYPLAGVQRVAYTQFDAITSALIACGIVSSRQGARELDKRKSVMVLPLEDLSPTPDNEWFADGLMGDLIEKLSQIKSLRVIDRKTSLEYKNVRARPTELAKDLGVRYLLDGNVRKFGDQIKISLQLLDIAEGEYIWTDSHRGEFKDIFDIQEAVALKVAQGLKLTLTTEEERLIETRGTSSPEAYELYLQAGELGSVDTLDAWLEGMRYYERALEIDPNFAKALYFYAEAYLILHNTWTRDPKWLVEAHALIDRLLVVAPEYWTAHSLRSKVLLAQKRMSEALREAEFAALKQPDSANAHQCLAITYRGLGRLEDALREFERAIEIMPESITSLWAAIRIARNLKDEPTLLKLCIEAKPVLESSVRRHPGDDSTRLEFASICYFIGDITRANQEITILLQKPDLGPLARYNIGCLYAEMGDLDAAIEQFKKIDRSKFPLLEIINEDHDIEQLRKYPPFIEFVAFLGRPEKQSLPTPAIPDIAAN